MFSRGSQIKMLIDALAVTVYRSEDLSNYFTAKHTTTATNRY
jgi:hypothetical protein